MKGSISIYKKARGLNFSILENGKELQKRPYKPGQHGLKKSKRPSGYGFQLLEKQKMSSLYGVGNKQFKKIFNKANKKKIGVSLEFFHELESRLDNLVYRAGFAETRRKARQLVSHNHILVNNKRVNIPSYTCKINDVISVSEKYPKIEEIKKNLENNKFSVFPTIELDKKNLKATFIRKPKREELNQNIKEDYIIEWFKR